MNNFLRKSMQTELMFLEQSFLAFLLQRHSYTIRPLFVLLPERRRTNKQGPTTPSSDPRWHCCISDLLSLNVQPPLPALAAPQTITVLSHHSHMGLLYQFQIIISLLNISLHISIFYIYIYMKSWGTGRR